MTHRALLAVLIVMVEGELNVSVEKDVSLNLEISTGGISGVSREFGVP